MKNYTEKNGIVIITTKRAIKRSRYFFHSICVLKQKHEDKKIQPRSRNNNKVLQNLTRYGVEDTQEAVAG